MNTQIHFNSALLDGCGVYVLGGPETTTLTITNAHFNQNSAGRDGSSLYALGAPGIVKLTVSDSMLLNGTAGRNGGSVDLVNLTGASLATFTNNHLNHNEAINNGGGIGIFNSNASLVKNKFANNDAEMLGDDIYISVNSGMVNGDNIPSQIVDDLIADNHFGNLDSNDIVVQS